MSWEHILATKPKARWIAVKSCWQAFGRRGHWPSCLTERAAEFDQSHHRDDAAQAWCEEYLREA